MKAAKSDYIFGIVGCIVLFFVMDLLLINRELALIITAFAWCTIMILFKLEEVMDHIRKYIPSEPDKRD